MRRRASCAGVWARCEAPSAFAELSDMPRPQSSTAPVFLDPDTPPTIATLVLITALAALNMNIFLPSLPGLAADFGAEYALAQLAVSGYLATTAVLQLLIGPLSDRYGRRPVQLGALLIFLVATVGCLTAPTIELFLLWRMLQAAVAAGFALSRTIARDMRGAGEAASLIGYVTMGMAVAPMVGPMIGGALDEVFGWRAPIALMLVVGLGAFWVVWRDLGETNAAPSDSFGAQFRDYPALLRSRRFWGYALTAAFASGAFFAFLGGAPYVASVVLGLSPAETGFWFGSIALGYASGNYVSGRYGARLGINRLMLLGTVIATAALSGSLALFAGGASHPLALFGPIALMGFGNGLTMPGATVGTMSVRPQLAGSASGLGGALMIGGGAALATLAGALLGPETGPFPLLWVMALSSVAAFAAVLFVFWVDNVAGPLPGMSRRGD